MKARLWLSLVVCVSAVAAAQMTFSGSWSAKVNLLPTISIDNQLTLTADWSGWKVGGTAEFFGTDGYVWQTVTVGGMFGPAKTEWTVLFGPLAPAYLYTLGKTTFSWGGLELDLYTAHVGPTIPGYFFGGPSGGAVVVAKADLGGTKVSLAAGFGASLSPFTITFTGVGTYTKTYPVDPFPGGSSFTNLKIDATGIPFCCGVTLDSALTFTKAGFDALSLTLKGVPLCCGVTFDTTVRYTTTAKTVAVTPRWKGIEGCLAVYGDAVFVGNTWQGIAIYGFKVRCALGECNYLELLTALNVAALEALLEEDIFQGPEFEYLKLGFCGAGCCGGKYTLTLTSYFQPMGSLFGLRRLEAVAKVPVMANFTLDLVLGVTVGGPASLALGWTFTF
ncbi:MAG: hypothetical protein N2320_01765 [Candidatus Bipolaricaulota bacterium]|nr:hypothetical protein [Candidatus Bipolaricaulota bacterium]